MAQNQIRLTLSLTTLLVLALAVVFYHRTLLVYSQKPNSNEMSRIPVVLVGTVPSIAQGVSDALKPAYEGLLSPPSLHSLTTTNIHPVIHTSTSIPEACNEFPRLLQSLPVTPTNNMGTHNYTSPPKAALIGRSFCGKSDVQQMRDACRDKGQEMSWIVQGAPSLGAVFGPGYAETIAMNLRGLLDELRDTGKLGRDEVFEY